MSNSQETCKQILAKIVSVEDVDEFTSKILVETVNDGQHLDFHINKTILNFSVGATVDVEEICVYNIEVQNHTVMKMSKQTATCDESNGSSVEQSTSSLEREQTAPRDKGNGSSVEQSTSSLTGEQTAPRDKGNCSSV